MMGAMRGKLRFWTQQGPIKAEHVIDVEKDEPKHMAAAARIVLAELVDRLCDCYDRQDMHSRYPKILSPEQHIDVCPYRVAMGFDKEAAADVHQQ